MAIDMSTVTTITLNNQDVTKIEDSLGNVLWQKGSGPTPTTVIDKFPDATPEILAQDGGPISDYTIILYPKSTGDATTQYPTTVDGETYPMRIKVQGSATAAYQELLQINVATNSTVYLVCSSLNYDYGYNVYIDGVMTSYVTYARGAEDKLALPMTSGVHTIGFGGNTWIWGIIGDLNVQNNN